MNNQPTALIGNPQPVPRTALAKQVLQPNIVVVYVTADGHLERVDGGRTLNLAEGLWSRYRHRIDVDTSDHEIELTINRRQLPSADPAFHFEATLELGYRVHDPVEVVKRRVGGDGLAVVRTRLLEIIRPICRSFEIGGVGQAEATVNSRFLQPVVLSEGIEVYRCHAQLELDADAARHAAQMRTASQQGVLQHIERREQIAGVQLEGDLSAMRARFETDQLRHRVEAIEALNIDEHRLLELFIAQNPNNAAEAINLLNQKDQARLQREDLQNEAMLKRFEFLIANNLLNGAQRTWIIGILTNQVAPGGTPAITVGGPHSGAGRAALPAGNGGAPSASPVVTGPAIRQQPAASAPASDRERGVIRLGPPAVPTQAAPPPQSAPPAPQPAPTPQPAHSPQPARRPATRPAARPSTETPSTRMRLPRSPEPLSPEPAPAPAMPEAGTGGSVHPIYLVLDRSAAAAPWAAQSDAGLAGLVQQLGAQHRGSAGVHLSVIGFGDTARILSPLGPVTPGTTLPDPGYGGTADFAAVFDSLLQRVPLDVSGLKQAGYRVNRPIVFFLSASPPGSDPAWTSVRDRLADRNVLPAAPTMVACGVAGVSPDAIRTVATRPEFGFVADAQIDPATAVTAFWQSVTTSLVSFATALARGESALAVAPPEGFRIVGDEV
ncbi:vWA domain-containing protein [Actinoplanes derwentensis]|uniref:VWFA domain-containing protein n=1 Tax=Actinoplanes derwentensis TaxID=113562 RepID=A0A1H2AWP4_9ACTN|nr:hypothetical protein [Actinoplanes derwentensis]GID87282.1 hypothetical protein Ade03nite_62060 [Actinoplanes derwentensis]SDT50232.1 hypothetical protein SAMN04489716_4145 [Actinoplanes derwentensis]